MSAIDYDSSLPARMARLPRDPHGRPVPWFVAWVDGKPDFRIVGPDKLRAAINLHVCWACGQGLGAYKAFVIGPMCAVNRNTAEPPCHRDCAIYCATHCDFLVNPKRGRRELREDLKEQAIAPAGVAIQRNPGVALVWVTKVFRLYRDPQGGVLFSLGDPTETRWFAEGRAATRDEVLASIDSGLPILRAECENETTAARRELAARELQRMHEAALPLVPA